MASLQNSKRLKDLPGLKTRPRPLGLSYNRNLAPLHPHAGHPVADDAPPEESEDEATDSQDSIHSPDGGSVVAGSISPECVNRERRSHLRNTRNNAGKSAANSKPMKKPSEAHNDDDPFGLRGLHGRGTSASQRHTKRQRPVTFKKPTMSSSTFNVHKSEQVKPDSSADRSPLESPEGQSCESKFKRPPLKRSASPSGRTSPKRQPTFKRPPGFEKQVMAPEQTVDERPKFKGPPPTSRGPLLKMPTGSRRSTRSSKRRDDTLQSGGSDAACDHIRGQISTAASKLNVDCAGKFNDLLDKVKEDAASSNMTIDDSVFSHETRDLPTLSAISSDPSNSATSISFISSAKPVQSSGSSAVFDLTLAAECVCPFCKESIDQTWREERIPVGRISIRQQAAICKAHQIHTAQDAWRRNGYPDIDWTIFNERLSRYHDRIDSILDDKNASFYRNALDDKVRQGKSRTLRQAFLQDDGLDSLVPGYYGTKGSKLMVDNIIAQFSTKLRRLDRHDRLIAAAGTSGYVQAVLAPELAVMLVMDDMDTDAEGARQILRESVKVGKLLNEEEDETMIQDVDETEVLFL